jgi:type I restriction enzyme S subunit
MSSEQINTSHPVGRVSPQGVTRQLAGEAENANVGLRDKAANPTYGADWSVVELGDCAELSTGFPFKSVDYTDAPDSVRLLRGDNIGQGLVRWDGVKKWPSEKLGHLANYQLREMDILLAMDRPWIPAGLKFCKIRKVDLPALLVQRVARLRPTARIRADYLYYVIASREFTEYIQNVTTGTAVPHISGKQIKEFKFKLPDMHTQVGIGELLAALDDRITLLRETNATLEAIAQALFKSWFVDFDPVRAKQEGRAPEGMSDATAALFPDSFEESAVGLVPRGWKVGALGDLLSLRNERAKPSAQTASLPYVPIENITAKSPFLEEYKSGEEANSSLILFRKGDILFGAMRPYFHKVCAAPFDGVTRTTVFTLTSKNPKANAFALFQAYQDATIEYATLHSEGSTIPYAKWRGSLEKMPVILSPDGLQERFSEIVSDFVERANSNISQAQTLATLRDTLLPRLISGKLRIPEIEGAAL